MKMKILLFLIAVLEATEPQRWINEHERVEIIGTKSLETKTFSTVQEVKEEIRDIKISCFKTSNFTRQQADSKFGEILLEKIKNKTFKENMKDEITTSQIKWDPKSQQQFSTILKEYFDQVMEEHTVFKDALQEIMETAKDLEQIPIKRLNSFKAKYEGELKTLFDGEDAQKAIPEQSSKKETLEWIKQIFLHDREMQVFHNNESLFAGSRTFSYVNEGTDLKDLHGLKYSGSLDTYASKTEHSGFPPLMNLFEFADIITEGEKDLTVASRTYLIWKTTGYSTPDHQDVHQEQHLVSYHQLRGEAFFHILPPIAGLFLAELSNLNEADKIKEALRFFNDNEIVYYTYLHEAEVIYLPPDMTHFVQVPYVAGNEQIDYVRAFEILFDYESMTKKEQKFNEKEPKWEAEQNIKRKRLDSKKNLKVLRGELL
jgi:hypothetical protein